MNLITSGLFKYYRDLELFSGQEVTCRVELQ
jgi:hypothetical protein